MSVQDVLAASEGVGVAPVVEIDDAADAVRLARTLAGAGLPVVELTLRTPAALDAVARIAAEVPDGLLGAGTLLTAEMVSGAAEAGAQFGVSPGVTGACLTAAAERELPFIPGAVTPTAFGSCPPGESRRRMPGSTSPSPASSPAEARGSLRGQTSRLDAGTTAQHGLVRSRGSGALVQRR